MNENEIFMEMDSLSNKTGLIDFMGRPITYLRVSLTERCNLRCGYCYGSSSGPQMDRGQLSNREIAQLIESFVALGISKVRFTGGEPLLREGIVDIVTETSALDDITLIGLTTNGLRLNRLLPSLIDAGLNRLNVSLDSLNRETFRMITGVDGFDEVYSGIIEAEKSGVFPLIKINAVVMRGVNDDEICSMARWALNHKIDIRFIEFMPTHKSGWGTDLFVGEEEIRSKIGIELEEDRISIQNSGPARTFRFRDYPGRISFISAVSRGFCNHCNRLRLTASGRLIGCLFRKKYLDLKDLLNRGRDPGFLKERIYRAVVSREFRRIPGKISIDRFEPSMRRIGG